MKDRSHDLASGASTHSSAEGGRGAVQRLRGRTVLLAHADDFRAGYIRSVVEADGAVVLGPYSEVADILATLGRPGRIEAVVLCDQIVAEAVGLLEGMEADRFLGIVVISDRGAQPDGEPTPYPCVPSPCGAFQIVDALVDELRRRRDAAGWPMGPVLRGH